MILCFAYFGFPGGISGADLAVRAVIVFAVGTSELSETALRAHIKQKLEAVKTIRVTLVLSKPLP
jgi:hypothetical protein